MANKTDDSTPSCLTQADMQNQKEITPPHSTQTMRYSRTPMKFLLFSGADNPTQIAHSPWRSGPHLIHGSLAHPSQPQTASRLVQPFLQGCTNVTKRQTDKQTDHTTPYVAIVRILHTECMRCDLKNDLVIAEA